ncbi:MAG TPA: ATP-binding protein [Burkholderiaceae bacterium]|nr:ATP-binding protein [Burkholderiaceae bacterium]
MQRRIDDAAAVAAFGLLPMVGAGLLASTALAVLLALAASSSSPPLLAVWALLAGALGGVLVKPPRALASPVATVLTIALAALWLAISPWLLGAAAQPAYCVWLIVVCMLGAAVLAMRPSAAAPLLLPLLAAALAPTTDSSWAWPLVALLGGGAAAATVVRLRRRWRADLRVCVEQAERLLGVESERDDALRTDHEKSRFLAIASHDLRQPVHALGLFAATLQRRLQQSPDEPLARNLMHAVDGLERSFNALLDISKLDAGAIAPRLETFALRDMFRRLHMQYGGQAEFAGLGLRLSPGGKSVTTDPQLLERIVGNLIHNAIKYTTRGGIVVVARNTTTCINIEVWDTGRGMAADELPRVFEEFYQVGRAERDRTHGLGMGLAIVKRLAALLGHRLEVASSPGRGTMFRIGVPIGGLPGIQEELAPADTQPIAAQASQMVLVVDDEEPIREGLRLLLQEWGYEVMTAADAAQAEQAVGMLEGRVDLVLTDLHLGPGPGGVAVIASVRRLCGRDVPAILVTGDAAPEQVQDVALSGDPVLFKPVQPRRLFDALIAALR